MKACNQCGKCCIKYSDGGLSASASEIEMWKVFRPDIYRHVQDGKIWFDPNTGQQLMYCPWLKKIRGKNIYSCEIYDDRPNDCKYYPVSIEEMIRDKCEMLEARDYELPKQAQKKLDELMLDSRPSMGHGK